MITKYFTDDDDRGGGEIGGAEQEWGMEEYSDAEEENWITK